MKALAISALLVLAGCATSSRDSNPPMRAGGPNWEEVDKSVQRVKEREKNKASLVETGRTQEQGFRPMSDEEYASALETARVDVRRASPKISEADLEKEAVKRADEAKRR